MVTARNSRIIWITFYSIIIFLLCIAVTSAKADVYYIGWEKTFGGSGFDEGYCVQEASDGGYVIAGYTDYYGAGGYDVYLIRTDSDGNTLWEKTFGGTGFITPEMYEL